DEYEPGSARATPLPWNHPLMLRPPFLALESQKAEVREKEEELARARRETPSFMELLPSTFIDRSDMRQKEEALRRVQDGEATYSVLLPVAVLAGAAVVAPPIFTNVGAWLSLFR
ncbi:unnamed protein product, partial [Prorocentrum cordatum]